MEERFSWDFSRVRLHDDARAAAAAASIHAAAYTVGQDIAFAAGCCAPSTGWGRELLAHELTHTIQQRDATAKAPPIPPGSALEREADEASRCVGSGQKMIHPIGVSALAVAQAPSRPRYLDDFDDKMLAEVARIWRVNLKRRPEYPDRDKDVQQLEVWSTEIERRAAVAEAPAVATRTEEQPEDEESTVVPMALSVGTRAGIGPSVRPAPHEPTPRQAPPSKFAPGGFTDEDIYGDWKRAEERLARRRDPRPFMKRFYDARLRTDVGDDRHPNRVWDTGVSEGWFTEDDRWAFEQVWEDRISGPANQRARHNANVESINQQNAWIEQFDNFKQNLQLGFIQGPLVVGGAFPKLVATVYEAYTYADFGVQAYRAKQSGRPEDKVGVALSFAPALAMHAFVAPEPVAAPPGPSPVPASARSGFSRSGFLGALAIKIRLSGERIVSGADEFNVHTPGVAAAAVSTAEPATVTRPAPIPDAPAPAQSVVPATAPSVRDVPVPSATQVATEVVGSQRPSTVPVTAPGQIGQGQPAAIAGQGQTVRAPDSGTQPSSAPTVVTSSHSPDIDQIVDSYRAATQGTRDIVDVTIDDVTYVFDETKPQAGQNVANRLIAMYGVSGLSHGARDKSRMAGHPIPFGADRGHMLPHAAGGGYDINLVPQDPRLNRGWSPQGRAWRATERYVTGNPGTHFVLRLIYTDDSDWADQFEYSVQQPDGQWHTTHFDNPRLAH